MKLGLLNRLFTPSAQVIHSLSTALQDISALQLRCARLESSLKALEASLDATDAALHKLRGQVHGPKGGRPRLVQSADEIPFGDKESLRAHVGLRAGTKYTHEE